MYKLKFAFEYGCYPVWQQCKDGLDNLETNSLPISKELKQAISALDDQYQDTFNENYPPDSKFKTEQEEKFFIRKRLELFKRLKAELPNKFTIKLGNRFVD